MSTNNARREALRALVDIPDQRYKARHTLETLAERYPGPARAVLEILSQELEDRPEATATELTAILAKAEVSLLRGLILEKLTETGVSTKKGEEAPLLKTFRSLDMQLAQWVRILGIERPVKDPAPVNVNELWADAIKDEPTTEHDSNEKEDTQ